MNTTTNRFVTPSETAWRTRLAGDGDELCSLLEQEYGDALVMTSRGVRVDFSQLITDEQVDVILPDVQILRERKLA
jgi:hypothetical protein